MARGRERDKKIKEIDVNKSLVTPRNISNDTDKRNSGRNENGPLLENGNYNNESAPFLCQQKNEFHFKLKINRQQLYIFIDI